MSHFFESTTNHVAAQARDVGCRVGSTIAPVIPEPPQPCRVYKNFLVFSDEQLVDVETRSQLAESIHSHHQKTAGGRKFLYVHSSSCRPDVLASRCGNGRSKASGNNDNEFDSAVDSNFCLLQQNVRAGMHGCFRLLLWVRGTTIDRYSAFRSSNFGSLHLNIPPSVQALLQSICERFGVSQPCDNGQLKVRCEVDEEGYPLWKSEAFWKYDGVDSQYVNLDDINLSPGLEVPCPEAPPHLALEASGDRQTFQQPVVITSQAANFEAYDDVDNSFASAVKKKKSSKKKRASSPSPVDPDNTSSYNPYDSNFPSFDVSSSRLTTEPAADSPKVVYSAHLNSHIPVYGQDEAGVVHVEEIHYPPSVNQDSDVFEHLKPLCIPHQSQVDVLIHIGHVCPYQQSHTLIVYLTHLRILRPSADVPYISHPSPFPQSEHTHDCPDKPFFLPPFRAPRSDSDLSHSIHHLSQASEDHKHLTQSPPPAFPPPVPPLPPILPPLPLASVDRTSTNSAPPPPQVSNPPTAQLPLSCRDNFAKGLTQSTYAHLRSRGASQWPGPPVLSRELNSQIDDKIRSPSGSFSIAGSEPRINRFRQAEGWIEEDRRAYSDTDYDQLEGIETDSPLRVASRSHSFAQPSLSASDQVKRQHGSLMQLFERQRLIKHSSWPEELPAVAELNVNGVEDARRHGMSEEQRAATTRTDTLAWLKSHERRDFLLMDSTNPHRKAPLAVAVDHCKGKPTSSNEHSHDPQDETFGRYDDSERLPYMHPRNVKARLIQERLDKLGPTQSFTYSMCDASVRDSGIPRGKIHSDLGSDDCSEERARTEPLEDEGDAVAAYFCTVGDFVEMSSVDGVNARPGQKAEVISIGCSQNNEPFVSVQFCREDGRRLKLLSSSVRDNIPLRSLKLLEKAEDRIEQTVRAIPLFRPNSDGPPAGQAMTPAEFFTAVQGGDSGAMAGQFKQQLVAAPFSLFPSRDESGVLCFFWDLEATGLDIFKDDITQIACVCRRFHFDPNENEQVEVKRADSTIDASHGKWETVCGYPEPEFNRYVYTDREIPHAVVELTGITNEFLGHHGVSFDRALVDWRDWIQSVRKSFPDSPVWFVAHNGNRYDLPLLFQQETKKLKQPPGTFLKTVGVVGIVDTVILSRRLQWRDGPRRSHKLQTLYYDIFLRDMPNEHDALGDVVGLASLMAANPFLQAWQTEAIGWELSQYMMNDRRRYDLDSGSFNPSSFYSAQSPIEEVEVNADDNLTEKSPMHDRSSNAAAFTPLDINQYDPLPGRRAVSDYSGDLIAHQMYEPHWAINPDMRQTPGRSDLEEPVRRSLGSKDNPRLMVTTPDSGPTAFVGYGGATYFPNTQREERYYEGGERPVFPSLFTNDDRMHQERVRLPFPYEEATSGAFQRSRSATPSDPARYEFVSKYSPPGRHEHIQDGLYYPPAAYPEGFTFSDNYGYPQQLYDQQAHGYGQPSQEEESPFPYPSQKTRPRKREGRAPSNSFSESQDVNRYRPAYERPQRYFSPLGRASQCSYQPAVYSPEGQWNTPQNDEQKQWGIARPGFSLFSSPGAESAGYRAVDAYRRSDQPPPFPCPEPKQAKERFKRDSSEEAHSRPRRKSTALSNEQESQELPDPTLLAPPPSPPVAPESSVSPSLAALPPNSVWLKGASTSLFTTWKPSPKEAEQPEKPPSASRVEANRAGFGRGQNAYKAQAKQIMKRAPFDTQPGYRLPRHSRSVSRQRSPDRQTPDSPSRRHGNSRSRREWGDLGRSVAGSDGSIETPYQHRRQQHPQNSDKPAAMSQPPQKHASDEFEKGNYRDDLSSAAPPGNSKFRRDLTRNSNPSLSAENLTGSPPEPKGKVTAGRNSREERPRPAVKHFRILKRPDAEKNDGKMQLAAAIAGLSFDVASQTYNGKARPATGRGSVSKSSPWDKPPSSDANAAWRP